ncbi:MAG TPA: M50 family metallopeptidase [Candidatus Acidoferrum sp.]|jgi:Zn-dependent protease|nr:M50 family metallopeptidase [Candidatus Acidoferrum sp.]
MLPTRQGSIRLFRFAGIDVFLHWYWFLIAFYGISTRAKNYSTLLWPALEYVTLFAIVLMHEFGHALACRQVGGKANQIVLWPLGGVAYVSPPPRPGPTLWSIAAGPLVNVALAPLLTALAVIARNSGWPETLPNAYVFVRTVCLINYGLLIFNLLPIYPLDGGQILQSLLWFVLGRARSLFVVSIIGFIGVAGLVVLAVAEQSVWLGILSVFILLNCWRGLMHARLLARVAKLPRRAGFACPSCRQSPVQGPFWRCAKCFKPFDTFETGAVCPHCGTQFPVTQCLDCGSSRPLGEWVQPPPIPV